MVVANLTQQWLLLLLLSIVLSVVVANLCNAAVVALVAAITEESAVALRLDLLSVVSTEA